MLLLWTNCQCRNKPKSEWAINKTPEIVQAQTMMTVTSPTTSTNTQDDTSILLAAQPATTSFNANVTQATAPFS